MAEDLDWLDASSDDYEQVRGEPVRTHNDEQISQVEAAVEYHSVAKDRSVMPPFRNLYELTSLLTSPSIWFMIAFSGHGKTTLAMAMAEAWALAGTKVWYLGLETEPDELRLKRAAKACGIHPGLVMTGQITSDQYYAVQDHLVRQIEAIAVGGPMANLTFSPTRDVTLPRLELDAQQAYEMGCRAMFIDHIDHITSGSEGIEESKRVCYGLHAMSKRYPMVYIATSQANMSSLQGDLLGAHRPVQPNHVWYPGVKRQIATGQIGVYRPLKERPSDPDDAKKWEDDMKAARKGSLEVWKVTARNQMGLNLMKHRDFGEREGQRQKLYIDKGSVRDWTSMDDVNQKLGVVYG